MTNAIIPRKREVTQKRNFIEKVAWRVPVSTSYPEGIKYSLALIEDGKRILAIDNFKQEGHHIHIYTLKVKYMFHNISWTEKIFYILVQAIENDTSK